MLMRSLLATIVLACALATPALASNDKAKGQEKPLNKGMEKRLEQGKELPPGWKKNLTKGKVLDKDVYEAGKRVTKQQRPELPETKAGEAWIKVADQIIRIKEANREILEVITAQPRKK